MTPRTIDSQEYELVISSPQSVAHQAIPPGEDRFFFAGKSFTQPDGQTISRREVTHPASRSSHFAW